MPFIRLSDNYIDHPKFIVLSDRAFRLWHEGMAYCRKHQTDGLIPALALNGFRYAKKDAVKELSVTEAPLWETVEAFGFRVHDYLEWNDCREVEQKRQKESRDRTKRWRDGSHPAPRDPSRGASRDASPHAHVPDRSGSDHRSSEGMQGEPSVSARVLDTFRDRWKHAYGYECSLMVKPLEFMQLEQQVAKYPEAQLLRAMDAYFASPDEYVRRAKHPLPLFLRDPLRHLATDARVVPSRPRGCKHQPPCEDDAAHTKRDLAERRAS